MDGKKIENGLEMFADLKTDNKKMNDMIDDMTLPCTPKQRGYIYGMCKTLGYDPHNLPSYICHKSETRELNIEEAGELIDFLEPQYHDAKNKEREDEYRWGMF